MKVRTRFAPSPTGFLHVGGVRTALFAWLTAKHSGGDFILRIEDTDRQRHVEGSEQHIIDSLKWLGLEADEGPYRQSEHIAIYREWAGKLLESGRAYADPYSLEELEKFREQAKQAKKPFLFREYRPNSPTDWQPGMPLRFKSEPKSYKWTDIVMGELSTGPEVVDDFIIMKADGYPTYNFAHIVDDHLMGVTHVIRSQEFLSSMPKFLNLYEALDIKYPVFATLPYVLGPDGKKKLSKRDGAKDILDYRRDGYLPEALVSFLATLGWNDGTEQEIFTSDELIKKFNLSRVQRSGAKFDEKRLLWINGYLIRQMPLDELYQLAEPFWPETAKGAEDSYKKAVLMLVQERLKYLAELPELTGFFFEEPNLGTVQSLYVEDRQLKNLGPSDNKLLIEAAIASLQASSFAEEDISQKLNDLLTKLNTRPGILFSAIRIAISGTQHSQELFGTLHVLGKERSLARLKQAISSVKE
jgi:glutamyl-tRNA synthetase